MIMGCSAQCFVCGESYKQYVILVIHAGAIKFLKSRRFNGAIATLVLQVVLQVGNCDRILDLLFKDKDSKIDVFARSLCLVIR